MAIDLTHEDYVSDGIFAITGPTGSQDHHPDICLALYGSTPPGQDHEREQIMSRHTGECLSSLLQDLAGRFRCHWSAPGAGSWMASSRTP